MKHCFLVTSISMLVLCALPKESLSQQSSSRNDIEKLKKMEYDWLMAEFKLDTATISAMMDQNFMSIGSTSISNKQQELIGIYHNMSRRLKNDHVVDSLCLDDMHIQVYYNTAVVTFISVTRGSIKKIPFENRRTRMYDVWIKRAGQWKAVSSQVTPIQ